MEISERGLALLSELEGKRNKVYRDSKGLPTIGVGHRLTQSELSSHCVYIFNKAVPYLDGLTGDQINDLLRQDLNHAEAAVVGYVKVPLDQNQFDALVCLVFNIGNFAFHDSSVLKAVNAQDWAAVPDFWRLWNKETKRGKLVVNKGLVSRREKEIELFQA
jgi:lysozyme